MRKVLRGPKPAAPRPLSPAFPKSAALPAPGPSAHMPAKVSFIAPSAFAGTEPRIPRGMLLNTSGPKSKVWVVFSNEALRDFSASTTSR